MVVKPAVPRSRRPRLALAAVLILVAPWSALWLLASIRANAGFDAWLQTEEEAGRRWTCPARHFGGFPFAMRLRCDKPTYHGEVAGRTVDGTVEGLRAGVRVDHPLSLAVDLKGPMNLRAENEEFDLVVSWESLHLTIEGLSQHPRGGAIAAERLAVTLQTRDKGELNLRAVQLVGEAHPVPASPNDAAFVFDASGVAFPTLDALASLDGPMDAKGQGVLVKADLLRGPTVARLEAWRQAGGQLQLAGLDIVKGSFRGQASGALALDEAHRPTGKLDTTLSGFEPIAARYGIPLAGVKLGGVLSSLLGGKAAAAAPAGGVNLPLLLRDGHVLVGPIQTPARLDPFY